MPSENKALRLVRVKVSDAIQKVEVAKAALATAESYLALVKGIESDLTKAYLPKEKRKGQLARSLGLDESNESV